LPELIPPNRLVDGLAVVVDVLRATTTIIHALAAGCTAVRPCAEVEEARALAGEMRAGRVLLGGERGGVQLPGFDLGNSPREYTAKVCHGNTLVLTTSNGTRASLRGGGGFVSTGRAVGAAGLLSLFGSERAGGSAGAGVEGALGAGMSVVSLFSVGAGGFSVGGAGFSVVVGEDFAVTGVRETGGFIQSSTHGTATAPTTPSTITTSTTRNQVAAKMDRGGTSSYRSRSSLGSSCCGLTATSASRG